MDLRNALMQTSKTKPKKGWKGVLTSLVIHATLVGVVVLLSMTAADKVTAEDKAIPVYVSQGAAPPPPPPPPPPAASSSAPTPSTPKMVKVEPVQVPRDSFVAPIEIPDDPIPVLSMPVASAPVAEVPSSGAVAGGVAGGVTGGVTGGVLGGVQGGTLGGEVGGEIGGVLGGVKGGVLGGTVGGTPGGTGTGVAPGPLRVGGNVKAPKTTTRIDPVYTEPARKARVTGVVVVEAIIDKRGNVDKVTVLRGLPMGLTESAVVAVKRWKFRPGTQNGQPVDVIFNLTVTFTFGGQGQPVARAERSTPKVVKQEAPPAPEPVVEPEPPPPEPEPEPSPAAEPLPVAPGT